MTVPWGSERKSTAGPIVTFSHGWPLNADAWGNALSPKMRAVAGLRGAGTRVVCARYYKTSALKSTLERLIDFDRINHAKEMRLSVGAVNVRTGHFDYFDSEKITIRPEHVMASGAIPPGFPPIEIDGEQYWDGGLFSNTPLAYMVDYYPRRSRLIFQVDVFPAHGRVPTNLAEVTERDKDIRYSSRTRLTTNNLREKHNVRHAINELHDAEGTRCARVRCDARHPHRTPGACVTQR